MNSVDELKKTSVCEKNEQMSLSNISNIDITEESENCFDFPIDQEFAKIQPKNFIGGQIVFLAVFRFLFQYYNPYERYIKFLNTWSCNIYIDIFLLLLGLYIIIFCKKIKLISFLHTRVDLDNKEIIRTVIYRPVPEPVTEKIYFEDIKQLKLCKDVGQDHYGRYYSVFLLYAILYNGSEEVLLMNTKAPISDSKQKDQINKFIKNKVMKMGTPLVRKNIKNKFKNVQQDGLCLCISFVMLIIFILSTH